MKRSRNIKKIPRLAIIIAGLGVAIILIIVAWSVARRPSQSTVTPKPSPSPTINYEPATAQEKAETEQHKQELEQAATATPTPSVSGKKAVTPVIASWGQDPSTGTVEVTGFIPGVFEANGTCTLTLIGNGSTVTKTSQGTQDVNKTTCIPFKIPRAELTAGTWQASLGYTSPTASGTSAKQALEVK